MKLTLALPLILAIILSIRAIAIASVLTQQQFTSASTQHARRRRLAKLETSFIYHTAVAVIAWIIFAS